MTFDAFVKDPWGKQHQHRAYEQAVFGIRPAPEFSTAEVLVASTYRASGFPGYSENDVPKAGRELDKTTKATRRSRDKPGRIKLDTWRTVVHGVLQSPKQPNQSSKRFIQMCPVVPEVALYSGSARLAGSSWNPGAMVQRMILMGAANAAAAEALWSKLHKALDVDSQDDIWARWLHDEFRDRVEPTQPWEPRAIDGDVFFPEADKEALQFPAQQFARDLDAVISAKSKMTRRQWISILESVLRLGCAMHVLWLCSVNHRVWQRTRSILAGQATVPSIEEVRSTLVNAERRCLGYGNAAIADIKQYTSDYLVARIGLNAVLWSLVDDGAPITALDSCAAIEAFLSAVASHRAELDARQVLKLVGELTEAESRTIACKKGIGSNMVEFARHSLGQRKAADETLRGYDQGYILRKKGDGNSAPWVVSLGPVAVLALVHSCLRESAGPRSVKTLCNHLGAYGIDADLDDVGSGELGRQLRMLGLVLDSPDAESGMLLVPPF